MSEVLSTIGAVAMGLFVVVMLLMVLNGSIDGKQLDLLKRQAMARGYAQYCPDDYQWSWKGECDAK